MEKQLAFESTDAGILHRSLGISDERAEELLSDVGKIIDDSNFASEALKMASEICETPQELAFSALVIGRQY